jgi:hypothetical protein
MSSSTACTSNATAELYDPSTGGWSPTKGLPVVVGIDASAVRLLDGRVLVSGGGNRCGEVFNTAALFDPSCNTWSATAAMATGRQKHSAILMADGRVLVAGGTAASGTNSMRVEVFDPAAATWTKAAGPFDVETSNRLDALNRKRTLATVTVTLSPVFRRRLERDMVQEWQFHLDVRTEDLVAGGMSRAEAEARARREFGDPARWKQWGREARGLQFVDDLRQDAAYAIRLLTSAPMFTAAA